MQHNVELAPWTTLRLGGPARYFVEAGNEAELWEAVQEAERQGWPFAVLGGGSNLLVPDEGFPGLVIRMAMTGVARDGAVFQVGAGEDWNRFVDLTIASGCAGVECLAGIPGSVGATPVQNVGAYGQEVSQTVASLRALDRWTKTFLDLPATACGFGYRTSRFNSVDRDRFVITRVDFALRPHGAPCLEYAELRRWFESRGETATLASTAQAVRQVRAGKGMVLDASDPDTWSAGSYFKNPMVDAGRLEAVATVAAVSVEQVPHWPAGERVKLSAAWLLERAGFCKGFLMGAAGLSTKHALALTNRGGARCADILALEEEIRRGVEARFGVLLEREPVFLGRR